MEKKENQKNKDLGFRPVARSFDEVIDRFGIELKDEKDNVEEPLPDIFKPAPRSGNKKQPIPSAKSHTEIDSKSGKAKNRLSPDMKNYFKRLDVTAGAADSLWAREKILAKNDEAKAQNVRSEPSKDHKDPVSYRKPISEKKSSENKSPAYKHGFGPPEEYAPKINQREESENFEIDKYLRQKYSKLISIPVQWADKVIDKFYQYVPRRNLAKSTPIKERLAVLLAALAVVWIVSGAISLIASAIPQNISGKWQPAESDKMIFEYEHSKVTVSVLSSEGEWVEYRTGQYKIKKQAERNLLTITYEDGEISRLYYEIDGNIGTFINVNKNQESQWKRIHK